MEERPLSSFGKKFVAAPLLEFKLDTKPFEGEDGSTPVKNCWYEEELWKFTGLIFRLKYSPVIFNFNSWPIFFFLSFNVAMVEIKNFYAFFDIYHLNDDCFSGKKGMDYIVVNGHNTSKRRGDILEPEENTGQHLSRGRTKEAFPQAPLVTADIHRDLGQRF